MSANFSANAWAVNARRALISLAVGATYGLTATTPQFLATPKGSNASPLNPFGVGRLSVRVPSVGFTYG
ncbi:exported hypothetical protein [Acidobacteriia bacterium SbA2]|nr:exported hypothetical protein [Acidobacteriia bacterium SbA2]